MSSKVKNTTLKRMNQGQLDSLTSKVTCCLNVVHPLFPAPNEETVLTWGQVCSVSRDVVGYGASYGIQESLVKSHSCVTLVNKHKGAALLMWITGE